MEREERLKKGKKESTTLNCRLISYCKQLNNTMNFRSNTIVTEEDSWSTMYIVFGGPNYYYMYVADDTDVVELMRKKMLSYIKINIQERIDEYTKMLNFINLEH